MNLFSNVPSALKLLLPLAAGTALAGAIALGQDTGGDSGKPPTLAVATPSPTPLASEQAMPKGGSFPANRPDCPLGWNTYNDPDGLFSLCYPPGLKPVTHKQPTPNIGTSLTLAEPGSGARPVPSNAFSLIISWGRYSNFRVGDPSPNTCLIYTGGVAKPTGSEFIPPSRFASPNLGGRPALGCMTRGIAVGQFEVEELILNIPFAQDRSEKEGYIRVSVTNVGPDFNGTLNRAEQILRSLRLP